MDMYQFFTEEELVCRCGKCRVGQETMNKRFMKNVVNLRGFLGFSLIATSAARCPMHNNDVSKTGDAGPHTPYLLRRDVWVPAKNLNNYETDYSDYECFAIDLQCSGSKAQKLLDAGLWARGFTGVGIMQRGPHEERFIHLDSLPNGVSGPRPWVWSY